MNTEGPKAVVERVMRDKRYPEQCRNRFLPLPFAHAIIGNDVQRDAVRREERRDRHQRFRLRTGLRRLGDGQAEGREHARRVFRVLRRLLDQLGEAPRVIIEA